jgi:cell division septum initiation protein DivIVA
MTFRLSKETLKMTLDQRHKAVLTGSSSPEQLRADIEETRERLAQIADKLTPRAILAAQAKQRIDDSRAAVADRAEDLLDAVSDRADELVGKAKDAAPDAAVSAVTQAAGEARARKRPLGVVLIALAAALVGVWAAKRG